MSANPRPLVHQPKPTLVQIGTRVMSTHGFRNDLLEEHLLKHQGFPEHKQWCDVACGAATFFHKATKATKREFGKRVHRAWHEMYRRGHFLVIEFAPLGGGTHGEVLACKFYEAAKSVTEQQAALAQLAKMKRRRQISDEKYARAKQLLGVPEEEPSL